VSERHSPISPACTDHHGYEERKKYGCSGPDPGQYVYQGEAEQSPVADDSPDPVRAREQEIVDALLKISEKYRTDLSYVDPSSRMVASFVIKSAAHSIRDGLI
jgi:hypothetical protein